MAPLKEVNLDAKKIEDTYEDAIPGERTIFDPPEPYCAPGFKGVFASYYVALCALFSALGKSMNLIAGMTGTTANSAKVACFSAMTRASSPLSW